MLGSRVRFILNLRGSFACAVLGAFFLIPYEAGAHPDLLLQIEEISRQIAEDPADAELYLRRADVYRRHGDWAWARADFETVRRLQPDLADTDWLEGRMLVESGQAEAGEARLTQFLSRQPNHPVALQSRARAWLAMDSYALAAEDFAAAVAAAPRPSPELYRAWALAQAAVGGAYWPQARTIVQAGLERFPREISLLGLDTDFSLSLGSVDRAQSVLQQVPEPILRLPQWQYRLGLCACIQGDTDRSRLALQAVFNAIQEAKTPGGGNFAFDVTSIEDLLENPGPATCRAAAKHWVESSILSAL